MNPGTDTALRRLRAADPATDSPDPHDPYARAMLARVLACDTDRPGEVAVAAPAPPRPVRRRLAIAATGVVATATATALAISTPWARGPQASAYTVDRHRDGSVAVTVHINQFKDPAKLNAELRRAGARTALVPMLAGNLCTTRPAIDQGFQAKVAPTEDGVTTIRTDGPMLLMGTPDAEPYYARFTAAYLIMGTDASFVIRPWKIPARDTLVIGFTLRAVQQRSANPKAMWIVRPLGVTVVPRCVPGPTAAGPLPPTR
jgi:hypothetical protein